jgi:glucose/arabinose dehydrogenase
MRVVALCIAVFVALAPRQSAAQVTTAASFANEVFAGGFGSGTAMAFAPDGRLFLCQQDGALRVIKNGQLLATPFVTLPVDATGERGLLGLAFDPAFESNQFVYVYYTLNSTPRRNRVSRFTAAGDVAVPGSEHVILELENLSATNHNGGAMAFGPDDRLYVAVGDNAVSSNSQTLANRLGKILRLNADGSIPADNPFFSVATGPNRAIWALGLRNPFTFAFDPLTDQMFINDVGQVTWEEVNQGIAGANYGWPASEGPTSTPGHTGPIYWYSHSASQTPHGCAITGGAFSTAPAGGFPAALQGDYYFADFCGGFILRRDAESGLVSSLATGISLPVDLDMGPDGHLYYLARGARQVGRIRYVLPRLGTLTPSSGPPYTAGNTVTWTASLAPGSAGPVEYQFWLYSSASGGWTSIPYGPSATFAFTPTAPATYAIQVWARNLGSTAAWESYLSSGTFTAGQGALTTPTLAADQQLPPAVGVPMTWTAGASGGTPPYTYQFWVYRASHGWSVARPYDSSPTWTWTPQTTGVHAIQVWVRSAGSTASYDTWKGTGYFTVAAAVPAMPTLSVSPTLPAAAGTPMTWTAATTGGRQPTQYKFWHYSQRTGVWQPGQDWSANSTWTWMPDLAGTYAVQVWVRSAGSSATWQAWASSGYFTVTPAALAVKSITSEPGGPFAPGSSVLFTAHAAGGSVPLEYQFWGFAGQGWSMLRDYAPEPTAEWTLSTGTHALQAWIRESGSAAPYQAYAGTGLFAVQPGPVTLNALAATQTFPLPVASPIIWRATATGGSAPLQYQFLRSSQAEPAWQIVQPWSAQAVFAWTPAPADAGVYEIQVQVRSGTGAIEAVTTFGPFSLVP